MTKLQDELLQEISYITSRIVEFNVRNKNIDKFDYLDLMIQIGNLSYWAKRKKVEKVDLPKIKRIYNKIDEIIEKYGK